MIKKSFKVGDLLERVNWFLKNSSDEHSEQRKGQIAILNMVLHSSGNYFGFRFLEGLNPKDETRVEYHVPYNLLKDYKDAEFDRSIHDGLRSSFN